MYRKINNLLLSLYNQDVNYQSLLSQSSLIREISDSGRKEAIFRKNQSCFYEISAYYDSLEVDDRKNLVSIVWDTTIKIIEEAILDAGIDDKKRPESNFLVIANMIIIDNLLIELATT